MEDNLEDFVNTVITNVFPDDIFSKIINVLQGFNTEYSSKFISENFHSLHTLEHWAWKMLSDDPYRWIDQPNYFSFFENLALFNKNWIFNTDEVDADTKASLLLPETTNVTNNIFEHVEKSLEENDPYFIIVSLWFDNLSYFLQIHTQFIKIPIMIDMNHLMALKFVMTDQYKSYLTELQKSELIFTKKQLFFLKTCSFSTSSYLLCKKQTFPFTGDDILHFLGKDYLEIIRLHSFNVSSWSKELLDCITHIINFIHTCCWWRGDAEKHLKIFLANDEMSRNHVQLLIHIISYKPFHQQIQSYRCNSETILIDSISGFVFRVLENQDLVCFLRIRTRLVETLLLLAETAGNKLINICAYAMLGEILCEESLKQLKITDHLCGYFFYALEHAWKHPAQIYQRSTVQQLLRGFLTLAKNDSVQQTAADANKVSLLIEMADKYPLVYDILWALSFNHNIQQQLRSNTNFIFNISHLKQELDNEHMRKTTHGILWNLEFHHENHPIAENESEFIFDIMISYSHKDKVLCKKIYDELIKAGYRVWIDFDQMHGNVMDAMAQAIECSKMILICMSEQYRRSNYCRAEAYYAFQRQLKIVPVLLQEHYKPDGWLLFLVGQLLYVDFVKYEFTQAVAMLFKELKASPKDENIILPTDHQHDTTTITSNLPIPLPLPGSTAPVFSKKIVDWTPAKVQEWLKEHQLVQMSRLLSDYDGASLVYLNRYLVDGKAEHIMKLLGDDSVRRTNENLSLIELARLQSLIDKEQKQNFDSEKIDGITKKKRRIRLDVCRIM